MEEGHRRGACRRRAHRPAGLARRPRLPPAAQRRSPAGGAKARSRSPATRLHTPKGQAAPMGLARELGTTSCWHRRRLRARRRERARRRLRRRGSTRRQRLPVFDEFPARRQQTSAAVPTAGPAREPRPPAGEVLRRRCKICGAAAASACACRRSTANDMVDSDPVASSNGLPAASTTTGLAYLHLMRGDFFGKQHGDVMTPVRAPPTAAC